MSRTNSTLIGAFVIGGVAIAVGAAVMLAARGATGETQLFVVQLEGDANGLRVGAPVKFKGVHVGSVNRIAIRLMSDRTNVPIAVICALDEERLVGSSVGERTPRISIPELVGHGLRARIETESLVTGIRYISTKFEPDVEGSRHGDLDGIPEVPWVRSSTEAFESGAGELIENLRKADVAGLVEEAKTAVRSIGELGASPEIRSAVANLDETLTRLRGGIEMLTRDVPPILKELDEGVGEARATVVSAREFVEHLDRELTPFTSSISNAAADVSSAARNLSGDFEILSGTAGADAPLIVQLQSSLADLAGAARAARSLLERLDRDPSQLLRGRAVDAGSSR